MRNHIIKRMTSNERGTAILIVLALIAMLTSVGIMSVNRSTTDIDLSYNQLHEDKAFYIAEAGMHRAMIELNSDSSWRAGFHKQVLNGGYYNISFVDSLTDSTLTDTVVMSAKGYFDKSVTNIEAWVVPGRIFPFKNAAFGDKSLLIENEACTDSYNSDSGTYAATYDSLSGDLGTNGTVILKNEVTIGGNLSTATAGGITMIDSTIVHGDTTSTAPHQEIDLVPDADYVWAEANNRSPAGILGSGYELKPGPNDLIVQNDKKISLKSGTYYFTSLHIKNGAKIELQPGADVKIYVTGDILLENFAGLNEGGTPTQLSVFSQGTKAMFKNDAEFRGTLYAPNVDFIHDNSASIYGAIVANSVHIKNSACIHYDRQLSYIDWGYDGTMRLVAWRQN